MRVIVATILFCVAGSILSPFVAISVNGQTNRSKNDKRESAIAPAVAATMSDSFPDPNADGRVNPGAEVTYSTRVTNNGTSDATGVTFTSTIDTNTTLVAGSLQVQQSLSGYVLRCAFNTSGGGTGSCNFTSNAYGTTGADNYSIIGGQGSRLNLLASGIGYNSGTGILSFDAAIQNLLSQKLGTIDGTTLDAEGVRLFLNRLYVTSGSGTVTAANADGTGNFSGVNQPYFRYSEIVAPLVSSTSKNLQFNVPNTVDTFNVDFLVSTKAEAKLVINEVLTNPGGTISDANGEWFEVTNVGAFPVNMLNFRIGDSSASGDRPLHLIATELIVQPNAFATLGNTTNTTNNGGVPVDYAYGAALALANSLDAVRIVSPVADLEIDRARYNSAAISAQNGISRELKNPSLDNFEMDGSNWADASVTAVYGPGGRGTPKAQNAAFVPFAGSAAAERGASSGLTGKAADVMTQDLDQATISFSGETVNANLGTLAPGDFVDITFKVTVAGSLPSGTSQITNQGTVTGNNFVSVLTDDPSTVAPDDANVTPVLGPTAANASLGGRVITTDGTGVKGVYVTILGGSLESPRIAITNPFGYYAFDDLRVGETYVVRAMSKTYTFEVPAHVVTLNDQLTDVDFRVIW